MLAAADALFATSDVPGDVTMDAIAAAAGVGKGTLFRAFGSRDGLLDTLWAAKITALREGVESGAPPFVAETPPLERLVAFLDEILTFKLENRHLIRARETRSGLLQSAHYKWMHGQTQALIEDAMGRSTASEALYTAHALLAALHIDLIEEMLASGLSLPAIRKEQGARVRTVIDGVRR
ncbi:TetR/AcrR family transcriptional regulator [Acidisoma silvae]|uniref:TetR/AcrR family transcriptional regulator n=1 Tax=Acidisoma silvae TaxID=2802396 RepID=A0A963YUT4_9PROT|nr:TetR/AcrR family transcriptional regulator [Acidisoma silvae]MCB8877461.1 TetR/AcrR family transcriptional regulator [Acidisoma silvae]